MTINPLHLALYLVLAGLLGWATFDYIRDQRNDARRDLGSAQNELHGLREAARISGEMLAARDQIDLERTEELNHGLAENGALRRDVDDGRKRLRIRTNCITPAMHAGTGTGSLVDAATTELAGNARPDYFTLRDQLALSKQMILGLQDHIRLVIQRSRPNNSQPQTENTP